MGYRRLLTGIVIGLLIATALPVAAGNGDPLKLGERNGATAGTVLRTGGVRSLRIVNNTPTGTPLELVAQTGRPPMVVNSRTKVANLNADRLDGRHSAAFLDKNTYDADRDGLIDVISAPLWAGRGESGTPADGTFTSPAGLTPVPTYGIVLLTGSAAIRNAGPVDLINCKFYIDHGSGWSAVGGSTRSVSVATNSHAVCSTNSLIWVTPSETRFKFTVENIDTATVGNYGWWGILVSSVPEPA